MSERSAAFDGVRGIAILAVMANHTEGPIGHGGYLGVDLFFVLSGYLISTILLREHDRTDRIALGRFYARRALRLYPALLATCALSIILVRHVDFSSRTDALRGSGIAASYLTDVGIVFDWPSIDGLFHTWSLAIEEHFYLVWPAVLIVCLARGRERWLPWICGMGLAYSVVALAIFPHTDSTAFRDDARGGALLIGCLIAIGLRRRVRVLPRWAAWLALATVLALFMAVHTYINSTESLSFAIPLTWLAAAVIIAELAVSRDRQFARVMGWAPLAYVGLISYGMYLYHPLVYRTVDNALHASRSVQIAIGVPASLVAAMVSYHLLELPFLRMKNRYASAGADAAVPAVFVASRPTATGNP